MGARQMKFTQSWLKRFLDYNATPAQVCVSLTEIGIETEKLVDRTQELSPFITAEILEIRKLIIRTPSTTRNQETSRC